MSRIAIRPARRLPAHCSVAVTSRSGNASRNVAEGKVQLPLDEPHRTRSRHASGSISGTARVPAHVERVRGGQRTLRQGGGPGLGVERLLLVHDQVAALSVATHARSVRSSHNVERALASSAIATLLNRDPESAATGDKQ